MALIHIVRTGETLVSIAELYGFRAWQTLAEAAENAPLIASRNGNAHALKPGDRLFVPDPEIGVRHVSSRPTGSAAPGADEHKDVVKTHDGLLEIHVYTEFRRMRIPGPSERAPVVGSKNDSIRGWAKGSSAGSKLRVANATVLLSTGARGETNGSGVALIEALPDGSSILTLEPHADDRSPGAAMPDAVRDHGRNWRKGNVTRSETLAERDRRIGPKGYLFEVEYRTLHLRIDVDGGVISHVEITSDKATDRPYHALCFWHDGVAAGGSSVTQVLEIDLKADFLRQLSRHDGVHPITNKRGGGKPTAETIDIFQIHHTTGNNIGSAIAQFTNQRSGAHFLNDRDGHVVRMADDRYQVRHGAGSGGTVTPAWANRGMINRRAIGVENVQGGTAKFTAAQLDALSGLVTRAQSLYELIAINHVIGHCDVYTGKLDCPGDLFPWQKLEDADVALGPKAISDSEMETAWGGFFAGAGATRYLKKGDRDVDDGGSFSVVRRGKVIASGLTAGPVAMLNECLHDIGYTPNRNGKSPIENATSIEAWKGESRGHGAKSFSKGTQVALRFFKAHYATPTRLTAASLTVSKHRILDHSLAKLVLGCHQNLP